MKVCDKCGFENPDVRLTCLQCEEQLKLTYEQDWQEREMERKGTDNSIRDEDELRDSWRQAMIHRFDWIWELGDRLKYYQFQVMSGLVLLAIVGAMVLLSWIFGRLGI